jgi:hypothetical protein
MAIRNVAFWQAVFCETGADKEGGNSGCWALKKRYFCTKRDVKMSHLETLYIAAMVFVFCRKLAIQVCLCYKDGKSSSCLEVGMPNSKNKVPTGVENFQDLADPRNHYSYIDETRMIADIIDGGNVLITRPRRWGKTLNLSMLGLFFDCTGDITLLKKLFGGLNIAKVDQGAYLKYLGQYPVIALSFKNVKSLAFKMLKRKFYQMIQQLYEKHQDLLGSDGLTKHDKKRFNDYLDGNGVADNEASLQDAIRYLSYCMKKHYKKRVYIFLDEYDAPLNEAHESTDFKAIVGFISGVFSSTFSDNGSLEKVVFTGILRIAKESLFSAINNIDEYDILTKNKYSAYYGFSEKHIAKLLTQQGFNEQSDKQLQAIKKWYDGYQIAGRSFYNPYSIMKYLNDREFQAYWINTGSNKLLKEIVHKVNHESKDIHKKLLMLLSGERDVTVTIDRHIEFEGMHTDAKSLWSFLLFSGYLTATDVCLNEDGSYACKVNLPNAEVRGAFIRLAKEWFTQPTSEQSYQSLIQHLLEKDVKAFTEDVGNFLLVTSSVHDFSRHPEAFYHGFMLSLFAGIRKKYYVFSNRESGHGRYDIMLIPKSHKESTGIILEFKHFKRGNTGKLARDALNQINANHYSSELAQYAHIKNVLKIGMIFSGKFVQSAFSTQCLSDKNQKEEVDEMSQPFSFDKESDIEKLSSSSDDLDREDVYVMQEKNKRKRSSTPFFYNKTAQLQVDETQPKKTRNT